LKKIKPKKKKIIIIAAILVILLLAILVAPKLWSKKEGEGGKLPDEETGTSPYETRYFRYALGYLAGEDFPTAKGLNPPEPLVTEEPTSCNVETDVGEYFYKPAEDEYLPPIMDVPGAEKRPVAVVTCEFAGYPYQAEVTIDSTNDKIINWTIGQR
jgi:hypothetical protein